MNNKISLEKGSRGFDALENIISRIAEVHNISNVTDVEIILNQDNSIVKFAITDEPFPEYSSLPDDEAEKSMNRHIESLPPELRSAPINEGGGGGGTRATNLLIKHRMEVRKELSILEEEIKKSIMEEDAKNHLLEHIQKIDHLVGWLFSQGQVVGDAKWEEAKQIWK